MPDKLTNVPCIVLFATAYTTWASPKQLLLTVKPVTSVGFATLIFLSTEERYGMQSRISESLAEEDADTEKSTWNSPDEVLKQLEQLVNSVHFRNSKRYPAMLRYLVEETLTGRADCLKERTLGIEVFGRPADYDTNADPVVRITAGEVRKRIAQYYQAPGHEHELRLELPLGSYIPHFLPAHEAKRAAVPSFAESSVELTVAPHVVPLILEPGRQEPLGSTQKIESCDSAEVTSTPQGESLVPAVRLLRSRRIQAVLVLSLVGTLAVCVLAVTTLVSTHRQDAGLTFFWGPFLQSKEPATIVLGVHSFDIYGNDVSPISFAHLPQGDQSALSSMIRSNMVPVSDVVSYSELVSLLARKSIAFRTQSAAETSIEEFRRGPIILIGGFDNMWTMRLTSALRFRFAADSESLHEIRDSQHPETRWLFDNAQSVLSNVRDYAIVARFFDPEIEQHVIVVAGIGKSGTEAAAQFVTDKRALQVWVEATPSERLDNVEIVLATDVIDGKHGPAHVVASYRW